MYSRAAEHDLILNRDDVEIFDVELMFWCDANTGARALRLAVEDAFDDGGPVVMYSGTTTRSTQRELLADCRYEFAGIEYWWLGEKDERYKVGDSFRDEKFVGFYVRWV